MNARMTNEAVTREELGRRRAGLRVLAGFRQLTDLAEVTGIHRRTIGKAERGEQISETTLRALASALGVTAAEYLGPDLVDDAPEPVRAAGGAS